MELIPYGTGGWCAPRPWFPGEQSVREAVADGLLEAVGLVDFDEGHTVVAITVARCRHHPERFDVHVVPFMADSELSVVVRKAADRVRAAFTRAGLT